MQASKLKETLIILLTDKSRNTRVNGQQQQQENWNDHELANMFNDLIRTNTLNELIHFLFVLEACSM